MPNTNPAKMKNPPQSPALSGFQPQNHPLDSTKTHFTVQEGDGDRFFIAAEPAGDGIEKIRGDLLAFDLQPGAMREEAQLVAEMLNRHIASISLTIVP